ncbi:bifunctional riboflavin kinase/FMN adenylyltransferase [Alloscardovia criceti]|uniref:bifunctional riboflavin kinase/FMN adenylyltransferase n=1 Tax=Alloscardovia criceti TaxID=356828 RepID=UPI00036F909B|nr:riboflavin kinase [Alloscardovia criceti]
MDIIRLDPNEQGVVDWPTLSEDKRAVVTIGTFDGVHKGHQAVLSRAVELAHQHDVPSVAITFTPRPSVVHTYAKNHEGAQLEKAEDYADAEALMSVDHRLEFIEKAGFDYALVVHYTLEFAARTYIFFLGQLVGKLGMRTLVLGSDATMGKGREGNVQSIEKLSAATGVFELEVVDDFGPGGIYLPRAVQYVVPQTLGEPENPLKSMTKAELRAWSKKHQGVATREYSSSMVRFLLARGCVQEATHILGRPHSIDARVTHGDQRGRELGFPTANCVDIQGFVPVDGVYAGYLENLNTHERYTAAISVGVSTTFDKTERTVEAYCVDADVDLYDVPVRVEFTHYLRPMLTFTSAEELIEQMHADVEKTRTLAR